MFINYKRVGVRECAIQGRKIIQTHQNKTGDAPQSDKYTEQERDSDKRKSPLVQKICKRQNVRPREEGKKLREGLGIKKIWRSRPRWVKYLGEAGVEEKPA